MVDIIDEEIIEIEENGANNDQEDPQLDPEANDEEGSSASDEEENLPFDKHPKWKAARNVEKKVESVLEEYGYDSIDEMIEDLSKSQQLQEMVGGKDVRKLLAAQEELEKIHAYWAEQELERKKEEELPDETIKRLERENLELKKIRQEEERLLEEQKRAEKIWAQYDNHITSFIDSQEDLMDAEKDFLHTLLTRDSFINDVDIENKADVKKMEKRVVSMMNNLKQKIIDSYVEGKLKLPKMHAPNEIPRTTKEKKPQSIKDSSKMAVELLKKRFNFE